MNTLAFDGRMGASGDMLLGALVAAGADPDVLAPVEEALPVRYRIEKRTKNGISATSVDVLLTDDADIHAADTGAAEDESEDDTSHDHDGHGHGDHDGHDHDHHHDHGGHDHDHHHDHGKHNHDHHHDHGKHNHEHGEHDYGEHEHTHAEGAGAHRSYAEVVELVEEMELPGDVEADALAIFELLGRAEASVHGTDLEGTHFHEVGADDAIADVVGVALLVDDLDVERVVTTPLATGGGEMSMSHGTYPVPTPAVVEIAERADWSLKGGPVEAELLTPTGAAILGHFAEGVESLPPLTIDASGYGAGGYDFPEHPNVLRAIVGSATGRLQRDEITVLETNLDDATPETLGGLQSTLTEAGARDVSILPATMKKSRPGHLVKVICKPADVERVAERLARETGTLGVREHGAGHRWVASRAFETAAIDVDGETFEVTVKVASTTDGDVYDVSAEYDDAAAVAAATELPIREVRRRAESTVDRSGSAGDRSDSD